MIWCLFLNVSKHHALNPIYNIFSYQKYLNKKSTLLCKPLGIAVAASTHLIRRFSVVMGKLCVLFPVMLSIIVTKIGRCQLPSYNADMFNCTQIKNLVALLFQVHILSEVL